MFVHRHVHRAIRVVAVAALCGGFAISQTTAGLNATQLYDKGMNALVGSEAGTAAIDYFHRAADLGYAQAQVVLGFLYESGTLTTKDPGQALSWYKKAAAQGDPLGQWLAGRLIYAGLVPGRDLNEAAQLLQASAEQGNPFGEYLLGRVKLDRQQYGPAAEWLRKAAEQGLPQAQQRLAGLLRDGQGVSQNKFEAYVWLMLSAQAGNASVANDMQALEADLGSNEVERAKNKARDMEGTVTRAVAAHGCTGWPGEFAAIPTPPPPDVQKFCR
jgi:TPR repeat protein